MVTIESSTDRRDGVTLVTATVTDEAAPTRVTVESRLDGPIWPPRRQGEPAAGWTVGADEGAIASYEGVVPADGPLAIGFASPAEPPDRPVAVTVVEPGSGDSDDMATPTAVLRGLGDPSPPALIDGADKSTSTDSTADSAASGSPAAPVDPSPGADPETDRRPQGVENDDRDFGADLPTEAASWLAAIEGRLERAEALEATASVDGATEALRECGGLEGARALDAHLATDAESLRTVAKRASTLAERAESTAVAMEELERLA